MKMDKNSYKSSLKTNQLVASATLASTLHQLHVDLSSFHIFLLSQFVGFVSIIFFITITSSSSSSCFSFPVRIFLTGPLSSYSRQFLVRLAVNQRNEISLSEIAFSHSLFFVVKVIGKTGFLSILISDVRNGIVLGDFNED